MVATSTKVGSAWVSFSNVRRYIFLSLLHSGVGGRVGRHKSLESFLPLIGATGIETPPHLEGTASSSDDVENLDSTRRDPRLRIRNDPLPVEGRSGS